MAGVQGMPMTRNTDRYCRAMSKQSGARCTRYAMVGARTCHMHNGRSAAGRKRLAEADARAWAERLPHEAIRDILSP